LNHVMKGKTPPAAMRVPADSKERKRDMPPNAMRVSKGSKEYVRDLHHIINKTRPGPQFEHLQTARNLLLSARQGGYQFRSGGGVRVNFWLGEVSRSWVKM
jgi:hypothetical protein